MSFEREREHGMGVVCGTQIEFELSDWTSLLEDNLPSTGQHFFYFKISVFISDQVTKLN